MQDELNSRVSLTQEQSLQLPEKERIEWVNKNLMAISNEAEELRGCLAWKYWKQHQSSDWDAARKEWIDLLHFVLTLGLMLGFRQDGSDLYDEYVSKNRINHDRQDHDY